MKYDNGFARDEFLQYMFEEFPSVFTSPFSREMLENVVDYGIENHTVSKNSLYYYLKDMIPEMEPKDLIPYIDGNLLTNEILSLVGYGKETENNYLGKYDVSALMNSLANNAWMGIKPTQMSFQAGEDIIKLEGYLYEPYYEDFSSTAFISLNDKVLFGLDSRNVAAYKNEVYQKGSYSTLEEAVSHIKEQIKGKEVVLLSETKKLDEKINSATARSKEIVSKNDLGKMNFALE